ncbi:unnamed protein product, partial [Arabidopsis halleri]
MCLTASVAPLWSIIKRVARHFHSVPTCDSDPGSIDGCSAVGLFGFFPL